MDPWYEDISARGRLFSFREAPIAFAASLRVDGLGMRLVLRVSSAVPSLVSISSRWSLPGVGVNGSTSKEGVVEVRGSSLVSDSALELVSGG